MSILCLGVQSGKPEHGQALEINRDHPFIPAPDLVWLGGDEPLINPANPTAAGKYSYNSTKPSRIVTADGIGTTFPGGSNRSIDLGSKVYLDTNRPWTIAGCLRWSSVSETYPVFLTMMSDSGVYKIGFSSNGSYDDMYFGANGASWAFGASGAGTFPENVTGSFVLRYDGIDDTSLSSFGLVIDGNVISIVSNPGISATTGNTFGTDGAGNDFEGTGFGVYVWGDLYLPDQPALGLSLDFWSYANEPIILPPYPLEVFMPDAAAPSGRIMSSLAASGGLAGMGGIAGPGGGLAA